MNATHLIVGLPAAGKTSFLAALWHLVDGAEVPTSLVLDGLPPLRDYLNQIRDEWIKCRAVARTTLAAQRTVNMTLRDPDTKKTVDVIFPDLSGEIFDTQLAERRWSEEYDSLVASASGVLLFINPSKVDEPQGIEDVDALAEVLNAPSEPARSVVSLEPWQPDHVVTQTKLVELLQLLRWRRPQDRLFVAVIVSCWDLVEGAVRPRELIQQRLPLLHQYLTCNFDWLVTECYGVSAQGGTYSKDTIDSLLRNNPRASGRILVVGPNCLEHDVTAPIKWLLTRE